MLPCRRSLGPRAQENTLFRFQLMILGSKIRIFFMNYSISVNFSFLSLSIFVLPFSFDELLKENWDLEYLFPECYLF